MHSYMHWIYNSFRMLLKQIFLDHKLYLHNAHFSMTNSIFNHLDKHGETCDLVKIINMPVINW